MKSMMILLALATPVTRELPSGTVGALADNAVYIYPDLGLTGYPNRTLGVHFSSSRTEDSTCGSGMNYLRASESQIAELTQYFYDGTKLAIEVECSTDTGAGVATRYSYTPLSIELTVTSSGESNVVSWRGAPAGTKSFQLYRNGRPYRAVSGTSFTDRGLEQGVRHFYAVRSAGTGTERSNTAPGLPLASPRITGITTSALGTTVTFAGVVGAQYYDLTRVGPDGTHHVASSSGSDALVDKTWRGGVPYTYSVSAGSDRGAFRSAESPTKTATNPFPGMRGSLYVWSGAALYRTDDQKLVTEVGVSKWSSTCCATVPEATRFIYAIDGGYLHGVKLDGTWTIRGGRNWVGATSLVGLPSSDVLFIIEGGALWRVNGYTGGYVRWGTESWPAASAMAVIGRDLFIIRNGALFRVSTTTGESTQVGPSSYWLGRSWKMTALDGSLFVVEDGALWQVDPTTGVATQAIRRIPTVTALGALNGAIYMVANREMLQYDAKTGVLTNLGGTWTGATALVGMP